MWLRDSTAQMKPYLFLAKEDEEIRKIIAGLVKRQFRYICIDPMPMPSTKKLTEKDTKQIVPK